MDKPRSKKYKNKNAEEIEQTRKKNNKNERERYQEQSKELDKLSAILPVDIKAKHPDSKCGRLQAAIETILTMYVMLNIGQDGRPVDLTECKQGREQRHKHPRLNYQQQCVQQQQQQQQLQQPHQQQHQQQQPHQQQQQQQQQHHQQHIYLQPQQHQKKQRRQQKQPQQQQHQKHFHQQHQQQQQHKHHQQQQQHQHQQHPHQPQQHQQKQHQQQSFYTSQNVTNISSQTLSQTTTSHTHHDSQLLNAPDIMLPMTSGSSYGCVNSSDIYNLFLHESSTSNTTAPKPQGYVDGTTPSQFNYDTNRQPTATATITTNQDSHGPYAPHINPPPPTWNSGPVDTQMQYPTQFPSVYNNTSGQHTSCDSWEDTHSCNGIYQMADNNHLVGNQTVLCNTQSLPIPTPSNTHNMAAVSPDSGVSNTSTPPSPLQEILEFVVSSEMKNK